MGPKRMATGGGGRGGPSRRSNKHTTQEQDDVPEIYQDMLVEAARNPFPKVDLPTKIVKRRKLDDGLSQVTDPELAAPDLPSGPGDESVLAQSITQRQTVFDDFRGSDDESDDDFEEVDLEADVEVYHGQDRADEPLQLDLNKKLDPGATSSVHRRKPATVVERRIRLDVHKWHVLCLLAHLQCRSHWCNDEQVQSILKPLIPRKLVKLFHLDASQPQYQRTHSFNVAIDEVSKIWRSEWKITGQGMRRAYWKEDPDDLKSVDDHPDPIDYDDFRDAARTRSGSRDLGAQLFCALLRSVAIDTRLVCSLQPLPFSGVARGATPVKANAKYIMASRLERQRQLNQNGESPTVSGPRWRLYGAERERSSPVAAVKKPSKRIRESPYPVFWVEVFDESLQKWIPIDPLVRSTINKPKTGFEPPANDSLNSMSYVIVFEDDASAKDVTRRYTQFYNGKTRRNRVESTKGGDLWWKKTMSFFENPFPEDRDEIENAELMAREESEQMPKNVQDFKNHPHYALERHLRRNEVIHPKREIGKVTVGLSKDGRLEPVFRRKDVLVVKTADQWYRLGRDIKVGEQPLKRVIPTKRRVTPVDEEYGQEEGALLYAEFQTELYVPPNVVNGKIPRNVYGNLDVYVPSMIPAGGIHVEHPDAARAARILGIDYADAVTGFEFRGRQGTAIIKGIVAATEYREALIEVLEALAYERVQMNSEKRSSIALQMWKKFLTALRIRERVSMKYGEGGSQDGDHDEDIEDETYHDDGDHDKDEGGGGFFPEQTKGPATSPESPEVETGLNNQVIFNPDSPDIDMTIVVHESPHKLPRSVQQQRKPSRLAARLPVEEPTMSGGFSADQENINIPDGDGHQGGGGFIAEGSSSPTAPDGAPPPSLVYESLPTIPTTASSASTAHRAVVADKADNTITTTATTPSNNLPHPIPVLTQNEIHSPVPSSPPQQPQIAVTSPNAEQVAENRIPPSSSSSLEQGSLLSHDPEDEDAEPDWLADAMDSD
ncbi:hypothetical protein GJ744_005323 [Endocarpon pusillum]|uniref:Rad4-domain-containing protein n=1 Tax=Endocarpon pusillum TaxID=364733 RepID=A0A8H7E6G7_9EURO|nr:hypothetical protein GJ744_005323 [Endocarpon pusillum]